MFKREHHIRIATILQALNADLLATLNCRFGGGTAIVLSRREYRESVDLDFLISDLAGYQALRHLITGEKGMRAIVRSGTQITPIRDVRADQYGIRTLVRVAETEIKFEIVFEARIKLEKSGLNDLICGVSSLSLLDMASTKLLANSDRWADDSVYSRDLIDLAMLEAPRLLLEAAMKKAHAAYGESIERDLLKAIQRLKEKSGRLDECMDALKMEGVPKALLWKRIQGLKPSRA